MIQSPAELGCLEGGGDCRSRTKPLSGGRSKAQRSFSRPRGAPGHTVDHMISYWLPSRSRRVFVDKVDLVSGLGPSRPARLRRKSAAYNDIRFVISDLCVIDFKGEAGRARPVSIHPGVSVEEVCERTSFPLEGEHEAPWTREPTPAELRLIEQFDRSGLRYQQVSA